MQVCVYMYRKRSVALMLLYPRLGPRGPPPVAQVVRVFLLVDLDGGEFGLFAHRLDCGRSEGDEGQQLGEGGADGCVVGNVLYGVSM